MRYSDCSLAAMRPAARSSPTPLALISRMAMGWWETRSCALCSSVGWGLGKMLHLRRQVMSEVLLHRRARVGIGVEVPLQGADLPAHRADRILYHRFDVGLDAAQDQSRADELTRPENTDDMSIPRHPDLPAENERHGVWRRTAMDHTLPGLRRDPGSDAQNLQDLARGQILEQEAPDFFFLRRELDRLTLHEEAP